MARYRFENGTRVITFSRYGELFDMTLTHNNPHLYCNSLNQKVYANCSQKLIANN